MDVEKRGDEMMTINELIKALELCYEDDDSGFIKDDCDGRVAHIMTAIIVRWICEMIY